MNWDNFTIPSEQGSIKISSASSRIDAWINFNAGVFGDENKDGLDFFWNLDIEIHSGEDEKKTQSLALINSFSGCYKKIFKIMNT